MKRVILAAAAVALVIGAACSDSPSAPVETRPLLPDGLVVSNAQPRANGFAYVSAVPATFSNATSVTIRNLTRGDPGQSITVIDGGFDPVAIAAATGDDLSVLVQPGVDVAPVVARVPARRGPGIVRTNPSKENRDVAIDVPMLVVFSETVEKWSVNTSSIVLLDNGDPIIGSFPVTGVFQIAVDGLSAEFIPGAPLQPGTNYALVINSGIRDLDADALDATITVTFATAAAPPVAEVGGIAITAVTTAIENSQLDPDGYTVSIDYSQAQHVDVNGSVAVAGLKPGAHSVTLAGLSGNCGLADGPRQEAKVVAGVTALITFHIVCAPLPRITGRLAFVTERDGNSEIYAVNADGTDPVRLTTNTAADEGPAWSPDGKRIAFVSNRDSGGEPLGGSNIYTMDADGSNVVRLTFGSFNSGPSWSPDGRKIVFSGLRDGQHGIFVMSVDNPTTITNVGHARGYQSDPAWSPDGSRIAFTSDWRAFDFVYDAYVAKADGSGISILFEGPFSSPDGPQFYFQPAWSPDGGKIAVVVCAYVSDTCHPNSSVSVANADGSGLRSLVQTDGSARPAWSPHAGVIAFGSRSCRTCQRSLQYMWVTTGQSGVITANGHSPSWRP